jgi:hypothetical protein
VAYMTQQWLTTAARDAYRARGDAREQADEAARVRAWLGALKLDRAAVAALVEPIAALEDGLRQAAAEPPPTDPQPGP